MKNRANKRRIVAIIAITAILLIALAACGGNETTETAQTNQGEGGFYNEPASQRTIRIAFDGAFCHAPIAIAHYFGFFEAEGLDTALTRTGGTLDGTRDALAGGHIDTATGMIASWLIPVTQGIDLRFIQGVHTGCVSAFVLADSDITEFEPGQSIMISGGIGGASHNIGLRFIANDGFMPDDFSWRDFPADQAILVLQDGHVDVVIGGDQLNEQWIADGTFRRIRSLHECEDFLNESCCVLGIAGWFFDENPETSTRIGRAVHAAASWLDESDENKIEAVEMLIENGYVSGTVEYAVHLMQLFRWGLPHEITEQTLFNTVREYQALGLIDVDLDPEIVKEQIWWPLDLG